MKIFRRRFGMKAVLALVALCALLFWAIRFSQDREPAQLYAGWLQIGNDSRRLQAAEELGRDEIEAATAVPALTRALLTDPASAVRKRTAISLAALLSQSNDASMNSAAVRALAKALADSDATVREAAASALGRLHPNSTAAVSALLKATNDENEWVRGSAMAALGLIEKETASDSAEIRSAIVKAMNDESPHIREMGIYAFWAAAETSPKISIDLLKSEDVRTRRSVVAALVRSSALAKEVAQDLTSAITDEDATVRTGAIRALGNIWPPPLYALPALETAKSDPDASVREAAARAIMDVKEGIIQSDTTTP
jgi:HEAT repeat protein